jgi:hypothetical protein
MGEEEIAARLVALKNAGASDAVIRSFLSSVGRGAPATPAPVTPERKLSVGERIAGFTEKALQTINPFQDELTGAVQAVGALVPGGRSPREAYIQERDASRARNAQFAQDAPVASGIATAAGIVPAILASGGTSAAPTIGRGVGAVQRAANAFRAGGRSAASGAKFTAPYAFGAAEGDLGDQLKQTAVNTALATGLSGAAGSVLHPILTRNPRGSLATAIRIGGTDVPDALAQRAALVPSVRAATPALAHVGPVEAAVVNRSIRTKAGASMGRDVEKQLNRLDRERHAVGEAKKVMFRTPEAITDPDALRILADARANPAVEKVVKAVQKDLAGKNQVVGEVTKKFSGSIGNAIKAGVPEAEIIAKHADPKLIASVLSSPATRTQALTMPVAKGFTYTENNPYTLEFFDRFQRTARKVLRKDYKAGGTAATDLVDQVTDQLTRRVREVHPVYNDIQQRYGQYKTVLEELRDKVRPAFNSAKPMGRRYSITAHPGTEAPLSTPTSRAFADPATEAGMVSAKIGLIRQATQAIPNWRERKATRSLLKLGDEGTRAILGASTPKQGTLPVGRVRGLSMVGLGVLGKGPDEEPPF